MSFGQPLWLLALLALPLLVALYWRAQVLAKRHLLTLVSPRLRERLAGSVHHGRRSLRFFLLLLAVAFGIVALAQPRYGSIERHVERKGRDVLIAIDTSKSMLANDTAPDRLTRAKLAAEDLIDDLQGDRAGLIAFAGSAFLQAPLTVDYSAVRDSIEALDTNVIPQGGTDITDAIKAAADAFGKGETSNRALVIFSDGEDLQDDAVQAAKAVAGKIRIFTVGVGTTEGALIPVPNDSGGTDFVKDQNGNFVKSHLDPSRLKEIAEATGGFYVQLGDSFADMNRIFTQGIAALSEEKIDARLSRQPIERYQWPLALALLLLAGAHLISDRRREEAKSAKQPSGKARPAPAALLALALLALPAHAEDALNLYDQGKFPEAYQSFQDALKKQPNSEELQFDAGASAYQAKKYNDAITAFSSVLGSPEATLHNRAQYNLGSALFQRGAEQKTEEDKKRDWENSEQHFSDVLKAEPKNADAQYNYDVVKKALEALNKKQEQQKQQQLDQDKKDQDQKDQDQQSQQNQQQSQSKNGKGQQNKDSSSQQQAANKNGQGQSKDSQANGNKNFQNGNPMPTPQNGQNGGEKKDEQAGNPQNPNSSPTPGSTPREGKIESAGAPQGSPSPGERSGQAAQAAAAEPGKPGEMTPEQARLLLESLKGDESKVQLNEHPATGPVLKDW
jgi:Ca-activated chloride channel family protein